MTTALVNAKIHAPEGLWLENHVLLMRGSEITGLVCASATPSDADCIDMDGDYLSPGFFDTQVNGGAGVLLNDDPSLASLSTIMQAHMAYGTTAMLATLITDEWNTLARCAAVIEQAIAQNLPGIVGVHFEGPFLNPERKGVHNSALMCELNEKHIELLSSINTGATLLTLAPERTKPEFITALVEAGIVVAAGHSAANYQQCRAALDAGLSSFTHLYNAMSPLTSREPGVVGAALEDKNSWVGLIVDSFHVHDAALKIAIAAKPKGKVLLVTDAMPSVAAVDKRFSLNGEVIVAVNGRCATRSGTLAGSDLDMLSAVKNTVTRLHVSLAEAINMASLYPAQMMGLDSSIGSLRPGKDASILRLSPSLKLKQLWLRGQLQSI